MRTRLASILALAVISAAGLATARHYEWQLPAWLYERALQPPATAPSAAPDHTATNDAKDGTPKDDALGETQKALAPRSPKERAEDTAQLDISRIAKDGTSVFAGTAKPYAAVTVFADGKQVATAIADANGEWSVATDAKIGSPESKITVAAGDAAVSAPERQSPSATAAAGSPAPAATASAPLETNAAESKASPAGEAIEKLEELVADARKDAAENRDPNAAPSPAATNPLAVEKPAAEPGKTEVSIPVPIMFVYNQATLTPQGEWAAKLLVEYVKLKKLSSLSLTGHADERGSDAYNMELSKERLDRVAKILRDGGYTGQIDLVPKGKSEPYRGIDRARFSADALYQMDRRVELKFTRTE